MNKSARMPAPARAAGRSSTPPFLPTPPCPASGPGPHSQRARSKPLFFAEALRRGGHALRRQVCSKNCRKSSRAVCPASFKPQGAKQRKCLLTSITNQKQKIDASSAPYRLLDAWRGVAALSVVLLHIRLHTIPAPLYAFSIIGLLGVPMFFVISGYCIANAAMRSVSSPQPAGHFLRARVRRIYPPYFFASLLAVLLSLLLTVLIQHHLVKSSQIAELDLFHQGWRFYIGALTITQLPLHTALIVRVFWSLCYEVTFYAIVAVLLFCAMRAKQAPRLLDALSLLTIGTLVWLNLAGSACPFP